MVIEYYDVLSRLRSIDLQLLIDYANENFYKQYTEDYLSSLGVSYNELEYMHNKLEDLGVLQSDRDNRYDRFFRELSSEAHEAARNNREPRELTPPRSWWYTPSPFGLAIVKFFKVELYNDQAKVG